MAFGLAATFIPCPAHLYDALDAEGVVILACAPVGLVGNLYGTWLEEMLAPYTLPTLAEVLHCAKSRLVSETDRTCSVPEAFAKILEEKVRGGMFSFSDLLVSYSVDGQARLIISPTAQQASITMLESAKPKGTKGRARILQ